MRVFVFSVALLSAGIAAAKEDPAFDPAADPAVNATTFLKVDKPKALAAVTKVAISNFRVEFAVENKAKSQSSSSAGWTSSSSDIKLLGITDETRQSIADSLYDGFVADLQAVGIEVIPYETLKENKEYQSMSARFKNTQEPFGTQIGKSVFMGAHGIPVYFSNDDQHLSLGTMLGAGGFTVQVQNIEPRIAKSLDATVIRAVLDVQFADQKTSGGMFHTSSSVKSTVALNFVPKLTNVLLITPGSGRIRVTLEKPVAVPGDFIELKDTTKGSEKAAEVVGALLTGGMRSNRNYEATAAPDAYASGVTTYGTALGKAVVRAIRPAAPQS